MTQAAASESCAQPAERLAAQRRMADEVNLVRSSPKAYAEVIEQHFSKLGNDRLHRGKDRLVVMSEGRPAVDEAIAFLKSAKPLPALVLNSCLSQSAQDHIAETGPAGETSHLSADGGGPSERAARRLGRRVYCGENISYGRESAREHVIALVVDDGVESRGHRENIFRETYRSIGIGVGTHARYGNMTVHVLCIDALPAE